jgi:hypothetical protein
MAHTPCIIQQNEVQRDAEWIGEYSVRISYGLI